MKYAGFWRRLLAAIIDGVFCLLIIFRGYPMLLGLGAFINLFLVAHYGFSIGKKICGIKVINVKKSDAQFFIGKNHGGIGLVSALIRETIGKFVSGMVLMLGFLWIAIDSKKQGFHDKIAKTYVVHD